MSKILHLVVTTRWYDAIVFGDKREEYRDITDYWVKRLLHKESASYSEILNTPLKERTKSILSFSDIQLVPKFDWKYVMFHKGYVSDGVMFEFKGIELKSPKKEWFPSENITDSGLDFNMWAQNNLFFAIKLGHHEEPIF